MTPSQLGRLFGLRPEGGAFAVAQWTNLRDGPAVILFEELEPTATSGVCSGRLRYVKFTNQNSAGLTLIGFDELRGYHMLPAGVRHKCRDEKADGTKIWTGSPREIRDGILLLRRFQGLSPTRIRLTCYMDSCDAGWMMIARSVREDEIVTVQREPCWLAKSVACFALGFARDHTPYNLELAQVGGLTRGDLTAFPTFD